MDCPILGGGGRGRRVCSQSGVWWGFQQAGRGWGRVCNHPGTLAGSRKAATPPAPHCWLTANHHPHSHGTLHPPHQSEFTRYALRATLINGPPAPTPTVCLLTPFTRKSRRRSMWKPQNANRKIASHVVAYISHKCMTIKLRYGKST